MTPMIALCLGGARCTSQVSSHIDRKRKAELNLAKKTGIPSKHPFVLFQSFKGAEKAKGAEQRAENAEGAYQRLKRLVKSVVVHVVMVRRNKKLKECVWI